MSAPKLDLVHLAIRSGLLGNIQWKFSAAQLIREDPVLAELPPQKIRVLLRDFFRNGGVLDARPEIREEYLTNAAEEPFWYRAIIPLEGMPNGLFVELRLVDADPQDPWVEIISAHRQES